MAKFKMMAYQVISMGLNEDVVSFFTEYGDKISEESSYFGA